MTKQKFEVDYFPEYKIRMRVVVLDSVRSNGYSDNISRFDVLYKLYAKIHGLKLPKNITAQERYLVKHLYKYVSPKKKKEVKEKVERKKHPFYDSPEWIQLRKLVNKFYEPKCMKCGVIKTVFHVDHIYPRSKYPHLELDPDNVQRLCKNCNMEKMNNDTTDYRDYTARMRFLEFVAKTQK
jgi:5-methylcytosine-specific restriction endonuclease McrA